jgi:DNA repair protein RadC
MLFFEYTNVSPSIRKDVIHISDKNLHSGHRSRMRRKFFEAGFDSFEDHELMEMLLFYVFRQGNTNEAAHDLINRFKSITGVLNANIDELSDIRGIKTQSALFIKFISDLCRTYAFSDVTVNEYFSRNELEKYISDYFANSMSESYIILSIGPQFNLLNRIILPARYINRDILSPRDTVELALRCNLRKIIIGHNNSGGPPIPTDSDYAFLKSVFETLKHVGTEVFDYIICGAGRTFSMRKNGAFSFN